MLGKKKKGVKSKSKEVIEVKKTSAKKTVERVTKKDKSKTLIKRTEVLQYWKENLPKVINTKQLSSIINELTAYSLGEDLTASAKNLRRYLRTLPQYQDDQMTYYAWDRSESDDLEEVLEIVSHYNKKSKAV